MSGSYQAPDRLLTLPRRCRPAPPPPALHAGLHDAAAALLALADDHGLPHLRAAALDYIVHHHTAVARTDSYVALSRAQVALVAAEACAVHAALVDTLDALRLTAAQVLPDPTY